jgi:hypothetical protein
MTVEYNLFEPVKFSDSAHGQYLNDPGRKHQLDHERLLGQPGMKFRALAREQKVYSEADNDRRRQRNQVVFADMTVDILH